MIRSGRSIAKYEGTQAEWHSVIGEEPSSFGRENLPVENVSWEDCSEFSSKTGLSLPTEAQWEYACRAGSEGPFAGTGMFDDMGWYVENSGVEKHPIGQKQPNDFGLYDMHGNVREWCEDVFDRDVYSKPEVRRHDPVNDSGSEGRVVRGGGW